MSGKLKEVRNRITSVMSTQQITKAMKMVAAAKLRRATEAIVRMRPYSEKLNYLLSNLMSMMEGDVSTPFAANRAAEKVLLVVITSDRGLCGGFNANTIKQARFAIAKEYSDQYNRGDLTIMPIGKKAWEFFKKREFKMVTDFKDSFLDLNFETASKAADHAMQGFVTGTYDRIELVYGQFKNAAVQYHIVERFLPVAPLAQAESEVKASNINYIFEPSKEEIIENLVPKILKTQFYKALLDSNASEHGARMTAMDKATENASELLKDLRISYNKERQAAITTELSEIVSGAAAMEG